MRYLGAKHSIGKLLAEVMVTECPPDIVDGYIEPFCGSLGVFKNMTDKGYNKYIATDIQADLIQLWKELHSDKLIVPTEMTEEKYNQLKNVESPSALKALVGFGLSYGGKFFGGYAQKWSGNWNVLKELYNSIDRIKVKIQGKNIEFCNKSYLELNPVNMLVYCDPPYKSTEGYSTGKFNHEEFWETMRRWSKNNYVFISSEKAPDDFLIVWERSKRRTLNKKDRFYSYERLYIYNGAV